MSRVLEGMSEMESHILEPAWETFKRIDRENHGGQALALEVYTFPCQVLSPPAQGKLRYTNNLRPPLLGTLQRVEDLYHCP